MNVRRALFVLSLLLLPALASGQVRISEVMYDLPGTDTGREWIEVWNSGSSAVDLSGWKLFEEGTNHGLTLSQGSVELPSQGYAIIADSKDKFLLDWPSYSGTLFDSSFSLKNTGETLTLRDSGGADVDSVTYDTAIGAAGDGNTLQLSGSFWNAITPTPGSAPQNEEPGGGVSLPSEGEEAESSASPSSSFPVEQRIFASAGKDRTVTVGADVAFEGEAWGLKGEPLESARFFWNFGDGATSEQETPLHAYAHPGVYSVVLSVSSGKYSAIAVASVTALENAIVISAADNFYIELKNTEGRRLDISNWHLRSGNSHFTFPPHTFLSPHSSTKFASAVTGLSVPDQNSVALLYPNGTTARSGVEAKTTAVSKKAPADPPKKAAAPPPQSIEIQDAPTALASASEGFERVQSQSDEVEKGNLLPWLGGLAALLIFSAGGALYIRRFRTQEIEIVE